MVSILTLLEQAMDNSYQLIMFVYIIWEVELVQYFSFPRRAWKFKHTNLNVQQKPSHNRQTIIQTKHNTIIIWVWLIVGRLFYSMLSSPYVSTLFYCYYYYYQSISSDLMEGYRQNISLSHQNQTIPPQGLRFSLLTYCTSMQTHFDISRWTSRWSSERSRGANFLFLVVCFHLAVQYNTVLFCGDSPIITHIRYCPVYQS